MTQIKETKHTTDFVVMPANTNYMNIIFGGYFMSQLDLAAATVINRAIRQSKTADKAVTHLFSVEFCKPCHAGDIVTIESEIVEVRKKAITVEQKAYKETRTDAEKILVASTKTTFVAMNGTEFVEHELELKTPYGWGDAWNDVIEKR